MFSLGDTPHTWLYPSVRVYTSLSSIKYEPLPEWFHLNQYALVTNTKLLGRISSKSLLKLTFHISKVSDTYLKYSKSWKPAKCQFPRSMDITKETDYNPTYLAINSHLLFLLSFIQIMWLFSHRVLCVKSKLHLAWNFIRWLYFQLYGS